MIRRISVAFLVVGCLAAWVGPADAALKPMREKGTGSNTAFACPDFICWNLQATANGRPINDGTFKGVLRVPDVSGHTNNDGDECWPADGEGTFRKGGNRIHIVFDGETCQPKGSEKRRLRAYGKVVGGTGNFDGIKGSGGFFMRYDHDKVGSITYQWDGTIKGCPCN